MSTGWAVGIALTSMALSVVSFGWQVVTWRFGRPIVKVNLTSNMTLTNAAGTWVSIRASNLGGMPVTLTNVSLLQSPWRLGRRRNALAFALVPSPPGATLPHRLEPGDEAIFIARQDRLEHTLRTASVEVCYPSVGLATGKIRTSRVAFRPDADKGLTQTVPND